MRKIYCDICGNEIKRYHRKLIFLKKSVGKFDPERELDLCPYCYNTLLKTTSGKT